MALARRPRAPVPVRQQVLARGQQLARRSRRGAVRVLARVQERVPALAQGLRVLAPVPEPR